MRICLTLLLCIYLDFSLSFMVPRFTRLNPTSLLAKVGKLTDSSSSVTVNISAKQRQELAEDILAALIEKLEGESSSSSGRCSQDDGEEDDRHSNVPDGVVRVYCTHSQPNYGMPWQRRKQEFSTSSGFVIEGRRIITNAHAVEYGTLIQVLPAFFASFPFFPIIPSTFP